MTKTLEYNGRSVTFKATASLFIRYKAQFGRDLWSDMQKIQRCWQGEPVRATEEEIKTGNFSDETLAAASQGSIDFTQLDMTLIYDIVWILARNADPSLLPETDWYDTFEDGFPLIEWFAQLSELIASSMSGTEKNRTAAVRN